MKRILLALSLAVLSTPAFAVNDFHNWTVGAALGQAFPTGPDLFFHSEKEQIHGSAYLRYHISNPLAFELNYNRLNFVAREGAQDDAHIDGYTLNVVLQGRLGRRWSHAAAVGAGFADVTNYGERHQDLMLIARYGYTYDLTPAWAIGAHAQLSYVAASSTRAPSEMHALSYLVSLAYSFGGSTTATAATEPKQAATPPPAAPLDSDGDGVPDSIDKCPGTPAGAKVNAYGCQVNEKANVKLDLEFGSGKAVVTPSMKPALMDLATFMKDNPRTNVLIEGHTDNTGSEATNKRLSKARAEAVRKALIKDYAVNSARVKSEGFGSSRPVETNDTAAGREKNRRVMTVIEEQ